MPDMKGAMKARNDIIDSLKEAKENLIEKFKFNSKLLEAVELLPEGDSEKLSCKIRLLKIKNELEKEKEITGSLGSMLEAVDDILKNCGHD
jgi:DNA repair ATPase RecN